MNSEERKTDSLKGLNYESNVKESKKRACAKYSRNNSGSMYGNRRKMGVRNGLKNGRKKVASPLQSMTLTVSAAGLAFFSVTPQSQPFGPCVMAEFAEDRVVGWTRTSISSTGILKIGMLNIAASSTTEWYRQVAHLLTTCHKISQHMSTKH